jgi:hypothetical protein
LVIQDDFSLFESVSAVEIMDPKMDSGLLLPEEALEDHYDVNSDLTPEDAIGIMDQLICHEMAWHAGYPLARTLFTSHHIDKLLSFDGRYMDDFQFRNDPSAPLTPDDRESRPLVHNVLRAYCIGLIKCCGSSLAEIERSWAQFYDEEDFSMTTCGRQLMTSLSVEQVDRQLTAAIDWVKEQQNQASTVGLELSWKAIATRLKARSLMVIALAGPPTGVSTDSWHITWLGVSREIPNVKLSHALGKPVLGAFSSKIQRRLASTSPLRPVVETSFEDASRIWEQLATDCILAWSNSLIVSRSKQMRPIKVRIVSLNPRDSCRNANFSLEIQDMLIDFTARIPEPLAYARACCYQPFAAASRENHEQWILSDIQELLSFEPAFDRDNWPSEPAPWIKRDNQDPKVQTTTAIKDFVKVALEKPDVSMSGMQTFGAITEPFPH